MSVNSLETSTDVNVFEEGLEEDFFNVSENSEDIETVEELTEDESSKLNENQEEPKTEVEDKTDLFSKENDIEEDDEPDGSDLIAKKEVVDYLKEKGLIEFDDDEDYENLSKEDFDDFIEEKFDKTVEKTIDGVFAELPDIVKQFNKYVINGGDPMEFILYASNLENSSISVDTPEKQKQVVSKHLKEQGYEDDYIKRQLDFLEKSGDLESVARKQVENLERKQNQEQENIIRKQKEAEEARRQFVKESKRKVDLFVNENGFVGDITITRKDKKELSSYMYDQAYKLQNGNTITTMQKDLFYDIPKNETAMMQLALILRNRNEDGTFNFDNIKKQLETKITNKIKQDVRRSKNLVPNDSSQTKSYSKKSLADFFD